MWIVCTFCGFNSHFVDFTHILWICVTYWDFGHTMFV